MHAVPLEKKTNASPGRKNKKYKEILVLGVGNILHRDDGVGVYVVHTLRKRSSIVPIVDIIDGGTAGFDLLTIMTGRKRIIIVDALKADDVPGSIYRLPAYSLKDSGSMLSLHEAGVKKIIDMLHFMGEDPEIEIVGIVVEDISSVEIGLSERVEKAVPRVIEEIIRIISE